MATPMVSGVAALIYSIHPTWSPQQVENALLGTAAEPPSTGAGFSDFFGYGVIDAQSALSQ